MPHQFTMDFLLRDFLHEQAFENFLNGTINVI